MTQKHTMILDITKLVESTPNDEIIALDIEGAPFGIIQLSCINGKGKLKVNVNGKRPNKHAAGVLNADQKSNVESVLKKAKILIGYNISSDITALTRQGIHVSLNIVIVDIYFTVMHLIEKGVIEKARLSNHKLEDVAKYFGITDVKKYHKSNVDAKVTMRLFHTIYKLNHGKLWTMTNYKNKEIANGTKSPVITEKKTIENESKEETNMNENSIDWEQNYDNEVDNEVYQSSQGFYEAIVPIKGVDRIVRMSEEEYKMYLNIRKMAPGYPLRVFYLTILVPGIKSAIVKYAKNRREVPKSKQPAYYDAPIAMAAPESPTNEPGVVFNDILEREEQAMERESMAAPVSPAHNEISVER